MDSRNRVEHNRLKKEMMWAVNRKAEWVTEIAEEIEALNKEDPTGELKEARLCKQMTRAMERGNKKVIQEISAELAQINDNENSFLQLEHDMRVALKANDTSRVKQIAAKIKELKAAKDSRSTMMKVFDGVKGFFSGGDSTKEPNGAQYEVFRPVGKAAQQQDWRCEICTGINTSNNSNCHLCGEKPTSGKQTQWQCKCTAMNTENQAKCKICKSPCPAPMVGAHGPAPAVGAHGPAPAVGAHGLASLVGAYDEAAPAYETLNKVAWNCGFCKSENAAVATSCRNCKKKRTEKGAVAHEEQPLSHDEMIWVCPHCTAENKQENSNCSVCHQMPGASRGATQNQAGQHQAGQHQAGQHQAGQHQAGAGQHQAPVGVSRSRATALPYASQPVPASREPWTCKMCGFNHDAGVTTCEICKSLNVVAECSTPPRTIQVWTCATCGGDDNMDGNETCTLCDEPRGDAVLQTKHTQTAASTTTRPSATAVVASPQQHPAPAVQLQPNAAASPQQHFVPAVQPQLNAATSQSNAATGVSGWNGELAEKPAMQPDNGPKWVCPNCTFENRIDRPGCEMCGNAKPDNV